MAFALPLVKADAERTESQPYVLGADLYSGCDPNVGSACFALAGDESTARIVVTDDSGLAVGVLYEFRNAEAAVVGHGYFCAVSDELGVPPGAEDLVVVADGPLVAVLAPVCPVPTAATTGTITVTFA